MCSTAVWESGSQGRAVWAEEWETARVPRRRRRGRRVLQVFCYRSGVETTRGRGKRQGHPTLNTKIKARARQRPARRMRKGARGRRRPYRSHSLLRARGAARRCVPAYERAAASVSRCAAAAAAALLVRWGGPSQVPFEAQRHLRSSGGQEQQEQCCAAACAQCLHAEPARGPRLPGHICELSRRHVGRGNSAAERTLLGLSQAGRRWAARQLAGRTPARSLPAAPPRRQRRRRSSCAARADAATLFVPPALTPLAATPTGPWIVPYMHTTIKTLTYNPCRAPPGVRIRPPEGLSAPYTNGTNGTNQ